MPLVSDPPPRARSMLFDLYGNFAVEGGQPRSIRLSAIARLAGALGISDAAARAAALRMVQDGWLSAVRVGRESIYSLTPRGLQLVMEGRERIFAEPDRPWDGAWYLVAFSVPEARRDVRDRMRKELSWLGFGSSSNALYLSPRDHHHAVERVAEEVGAAQYVQIYRAGALRPADPRDLVARAWGDLADVNARYDEFVTRFEPQLATVQAGIEHGTLSHREAFRLQLTLAGQIRRCLFNDPDLPADLLPAGWQGGVARRLFLALHRLLYPHAAAYFQLVADGTPHRGAAPRAVGRQTPAA